jgi:hypothetical protein
MARDLRALLTAQALRSRERFLSGCEAEAARRTQGEMLQRCLRPNARTSFGREHGFASLSDLQAYRSAVPIRGYAELEPWIERSVQGEASVLTGEQPIRFWKTTGTTARAKRIPVTPSSSAATMESFLTLQGTQLHFYPELAERPDTTLLTHLSPRPIKEHLGPRRVPYCSTTELPVEVRPGRQDIVAPWLAGLQEVIADDAERLYYLLLSASSHDLLCIGCLHPSRFQTVANTLAQSAPRLIQELREGTVLGVPARPPRAERARELELVLELTGRLRPRDVWPNLKVLTGWSGSYLGRYRPLMEESFCSGFLAMPSISSEVFLSMTIDESTLGHPLNLRGGLFEFASAAEPVQPGSTTLSFWELREGETYEAVITTQAGLYRYATADLFRVCGWVGALPRLEYAGRRSVCDLTGEKLAEDQVAEAVSALLSEYGATEAHFTLCGVQAESPEQQPAYVLVLESRRALPCDLLGQRLDAALRALNSRYEMKRSFQDLGPLSVRPVPAGTFAHYRQALIASGAPAGQLKEAILAVQGARVLAALLGAGAR